jgi:hypothetical protein
VTPLEFVAMARELKELGLTKLVVSKEGAFEATFGGNGPKLVPVQSPIQDHVEKREPRIRIPEEAPADAEGRQAWREDVMKKVTGGG